MLPSIKFLSLSLSPTPLTPYALCYYFCCCLLFLQNAKLRMPHVRLKSKFSRGSLRCVCKIKEHPSGQTRNELKMVKTKSHEHTHPNSETGYMFWCVGGFMQTHIAFCIAFYTRICIFKLKLMDTYNVNSFIINMHQIRWLHFCGFYFSKISLKHRSDISLLFQICACIDLVLMEEFQYVEIIFYRKLVFSSINIFQMNFEWSITW